MSISMTLLAEELAVLHAYSAGSIGWRAACRDIGLMDIGELQDLLDAHALPAPPADDSPLDEKTVQRFEAILKGAADGA